MSENIMYKYFTEGDVMNAYKNGMYIQISVKGQNEWVDCHVEPSWEWCRYDYRVKINCSGLNIHEFLRRMVESDRKVVAFCNFAGEEREYVDPNDIVESILKGSIKTLSIKFKAEPVPWDYKDFLKKYKYLYKRRGAEIYKTLAVIAPDKIETADGCTYEIGDFCDNFDMVTFIGSTVKITQLFKSR